VGYNTGLSARVRVGGNEKAEATGQENVKGGNRAKEGIEH